MKQNRILIGFLVLVLAAMACQVNLTNPTPTAVPTDTPTATPVSTATSTPTNTPTSVPTLVPPTATATPEPVADIETLLKDNGFANTGRDAKCDTPCTDYLNTSHGVFLVQVYDNGMVAMIIPINADHEAVGKITDDLLNKVYGPEVDTWVGSNMSAAQKATQQGTVGKYKLYLEFTRAAKGKDAYFVLAIAPIESSGSTG